MREIGKRLKSMRSYLGFGQKYIAEAIGISQAAYSKIESGHIPVTREKLEAIAKVMGVSLDEISNFSSPASIKRSVQDPQEEYIIHSLMNESKIGLEVMRKEVSMLRNEIALLKESISDKNRIIELLEQELKKKK